VDKFADYSAYTRSINGLTYVTEGVNVLLSGKVIDALDCGTHTLFLADLTEARRLNGDASVTYDYYHKNIKPAPTAEQQKKKGWVCTVCGYIHESDTLPADFICPVCKHGAEVFIPLGSTAETKKPEPEQKPEPVKAAEQEKTAEPEKKKGFVCGICGYVLESDTLPDDYICPICSNPASAFSPIE
jgi:rubrerythrin